MIVGIGCDLVEIARIRSAYERLKVPFLQRIYREEEQSYCFSLADPFPSLAARFAAKEALSKALGVGIGELFGWHDSFVQLDAKKKPHLVVSDYVNTTFGPLIYHLSLSHTKEYAMAQVVVESSL